MVLVVLIMMMVVQFDEVDGTDDGDADFEDGIHGNLAKPALRVITI